MRIPLPILLWLSLLATTEGTTRTLTFVYQPLTTLGTDIDAGIVIARTPVLMDAVPEGLLSHVASPNKLLQDESAKIADSNILSKLGISLSAKAIEGASYAVTMDLSRAGDPSEHGVTLEAVVAAAVECINKTIIDTNIFHGESQQVTWSLEMKADAKTLLALEKYQRAYEPQKSKRAEDKGKPAVVAHVEGLIDGLTAENKANNWPSTGAFKKWNASVNTFTHEIPSSSVQSLYYRACDKLKKLYGAEVVTYRWEDQFGYPGQVSIVQFENEISGSSYLMAGVFEANDNDSFWFSYVDGTYDATDREKRPDWKLGSILRCNWGQSDRSGSTDQPNGAQESKSVGDEETKPKQ